MWVSLSPASHPQLPEVPDEHRIDRNRMPKDLTNSSASGYTIMAPMSGCDFDAYYALRWHCLRAPHNMPRGSERDDDDDGAHHVMAKNGEGRVIGVARLHPNQDGAMQLRYMAVDNAYRRRGVASAMLAHLEDVARTGKHKRIMLNAREGAVPFYLSRGYRITPDTARGAIADIKHYVMQKRL